MAKKYVPEGVYLACDKGTCSSQLRVGNHKNTTIYSSPLATEADKYPFFNIKPMGLCKAKLFMGCLPAVPKWDNPKEGVAINGNRLLLEDSTAKCIMGGEITIHFDVASANEVALWGGIKKPTAYIQDGFDWAFATMDKARAERDALLPDWMKPVAHVQDWFIDTTVGLAEGAVTGVVGLGETVYQVARDPVGTAEALGDMAGKAWNATTEGIAQGAEWASSGENWGNAANGAWEWASDGDNWAAAAESTWEGTKDAANWVAENPRKIGTTVGEFVPDAVAAVYTGGTTLAASGARVAGKKVLKEAVEEVVEEAIERTAREVAEETLENTGQRAAREVLEEGLENSGDDIARVVTRSADDIQDDLVRQVKDGDIELTNNARKGNFGEMATDQDLMSKGYEPLHDRVTDIDAPMQQGIDGVYRNSNPPPDFLVVDAKYGSSQLGKLSDGTRQMSDDWINDRLADAVGDQDIMDEIMESGYERVVGKVDDAGNIVYKSVDESGYIVRGNAGIFTP